MYKKSYYIALRKRANEADFFWKDSQFMFEEFKPKNKRYWIADPFLFEHINITYLFYEAYDRIKKKGVIAYSIVEEQCITEPMVVIEKEYHLSFPYVFGYNGEIYMIPETGDNNSIRLFKAISFPNIWSDITLIDNIYSCDTIIALHNHKHIGLITSKMFKNLPNNRLTSCYVQNVFYPLKWVNGNMVVDKNETTLSTGDLGIRNAGACFYTDEKLMRPGQDCSNNSYGNGIIFFEVQDIYPYSEIEVNRLTKEELNEHLHRGGRGPLLGTHTYNLCKRYEVVDYSFMDKIPVWVIWAHYCYAIIRRLKKWFHINIGGRKIDGY
ncbi:hypothetical protein AALB16_08225 [Lachnospiraceae bacterium 62-35]